MRELRWKPDRLSSIENVDGMVVEVVECGPGDGYQYAALVALLPMSFDGGDQKTHVHVSVTSPIRWSYTFGYGDDGFLSSNYVAEKMLGQGLTLTQVELFAEKMTAFLGMVLRRPTDVERRMSDV